MSITLADVNATLGEIRDEAKDTNKSMSSLVDKITTLVEGSEMQRLQGLNRRGGPSGSGGSGPSADAPNTGGSLSDSWSGRKLAGLGIGLGAAGVGLLKGAAGIGLMGAAIPAFFGGLLSGSEGLEWLQKTKGMDFDGLKMAATGFADIITGMDPASFGVLGAIMAASAVGGTKAALGVGTMGAGITAFFGGLLLGDSLFAGFKALGGNFEFASLKKIMVGFSDMIMGLTPAAAGILAGIMGLSALTSFSGKDPKALALNMGALGLGIIGFLGSIVLGNDLFEFAEAKGANLDFPALKKVLSGFSDSISGLTKEAAIALAGILGGSAAMAKFGADKGTALNTAAMMAGIGAGISGLMFGLTAGDAAISWLQKTSGADGSGLTSAFKMFNDSVGALNNENAIIALGAILGVGTVIGTIAGTAGIGAGIGIFGIMSGIGAGIAGLMVGLTAGDVLTSWMQKVKAGGDETGLPAVFRMFSNSITALTPEAIKRLSELSEMGFTGLAGSLGGLSAGMVALMGTNGLSKLTDVLNDAVFGTIDKIFGTDYSEKSAVQQMVDGLKPLDDFDVSKVDKFSNAINGLSDSFVNLSNVKIGNSTQNLGKILKDIGGIIDAWPYLLNGGTWSGTRWGWGDNVSFGPEGKGGLKNLNPQDIQIAGKYISDLRNALGGIVPEAPKLSSRLDTKGSISLADIAASIPQEVSIVKISSDVLTQLTTTLMQKDYQNANISAGTVIVQGGNTSISNSTSAPSYVVPMGDTVDLLDVKGPR